MLRSLHVIAIAAVGTKSVSELIMPGEGEVERPSGQIECLDGFTVSVQAGIGMYSLPRSSRSGYDGPYTHVEVGFPNEQPEPWKVWSTYAQNVYDATGTVYSFVPIELVDDLIMFHGGSLADAQS